MEDESLRYKIHLKKPDYTVLKKIKGDKKLKTLDIGEYNITEDFNYERKLCFYMYLG